MSKNTLFIIVIIVIITLNVCNTLRFRKLSRDDFACAHMGGGLSTDKDSFCVQEPNNQIIENYSEKECDLISNKNKNYSMSGTRIIPDAYKEYELRKDIRTEISDRDTQIPGDPISYPQFVNSSINISNKVPQ